MLLADEDAVVVVCIDDKHKDELLRDVLDVFDVSECCVDSEADNDGG